MSTAKSQVSPPEFGPAFQQTLGDLFAWRRDVRRFRTDPVPADLLDRILDMACLSPSVGNSQPWRFVTVDEPARRQGVLRDFESANDAALQGYHGERAKLYTSLKLAGLKEAPVHLAVFSDEGTAQGHGLGRATMPETLRYSTVTAVYGLWLAARAFGVGVGWVSIINPKAVTELLDVPESWTLVAYLCVGWPLQEQVEPELAVAGWQSRESVCRQILRR
jgi:5,6-dimethylbenzimidazole synthase